MEPSRRAVHGYLLWPAVWLGAPPDGINVSVEPGEWPPDPDFRQLEDIVASAELSGVRVRAARDGLITFDFSDWGPELDSQGRESDFDVLARTALNRATLMNAHQACLASAAVELQHVALTPRPASPNSSFPRAAFDDPISGSLPDPLLSHVYMARHASTYGRYSPAVLDFRLMRPFTIDVSTVERSFLILDELLQRETTRALEMAELHLRAAYGYSQHDYSVSLILSWTLIEALVTDLWDDFVASRGRRRITMSVGLLGDVLTAIGVLNTQVHTDLDFVRRARNGWMHSLEPVDPPTAWTAFSLAASLLERTANIRLSLAPNRSLSL